jgi:hypothetical protein
MTDMMMMMMMMMMNYRDCIIYIPEFQTLDLCLKEKTSHSFIQFLKYQVQILQTISDILSGLPHSGSQGFYQSMVVLV